MFLRDTRVGFISARRNPPEEGCDGEGGEGDMGEEAGPDPPQNVFLTFLSPVGGREDGRVFSFVISLVISLVYFPPFPLLGGQWSRRLGCPARTD